MIASSIFLLLFSGGSAFFLFNARKIRRNILLGKKTDRTDRPLERLKVMTLVALGQKKMFRPILRALKKKNALPPANNKMNIMLAIITLYGFKILTNVEFRASLKTLPFMASTRHPSPEEKGTRSF